LAVLDAKERSLQTLTLGAAADRTPWFCSGCPHNTSTKVPEGSRAMAGIGCHFMSIWMDRSTVGFTQMGGEGVPWSGQQPFSTDQHIFANIGDGTYFHSGILAVRQSVASGVNITYKILYNDAVAMTGGQQVGERPEGHSVVQIAMSMKAEGAQRIVVVTDEPGKYEGVALAEGVRVFHRDELDRIQREMREIKGTTVIIYDQTCATEKRRRRKRGTLVDPSKRVVINPLVCEGCGDCGVQSNCLSVEPLETEFGRKRTINQSSCNKDYSCVKGFCPSFVTVEGGTLKKKSASLAAPAQGDLGPLPEPHLPALHAIEGDHDRAAGVWGGVVAGVGGTGVITIGQLLGMAAHLEGRGVVTQDAAGLAQKGGATWSHVLIAATQSDIRTTRVGTAAADLVLGCDPIVAAGKETLLRIRPGRTHVALNAHSAPTAAFVKQADWQNPVAQCVADITAAVQGAEACGDSQPSASVGGPIASFDASAAALALMGDSLYANPMLLGFAWQQGWIPLGRAALLQAMALNAVAVEKNQAAFEWGRRAAHDPETLQRVLAPAQTLHFQPRESLSALLARRVEFLTSYQNSAYAQSYLTTVERVRVAEAALFGDGTPQAQRLSLTEAVARNLFKLMAYKDEYEVARLHSDPAFLDSIRGQFDGEVRLHYHLAPPLLARKNERGELQKQDFGPAMGSIFKLLARLKGLRGTPFDPFGYTAERRTERALIHEYRSCVDELLTGLTSERHAQALTIARLPEGIKGYGHVKERHLLDVRGRWDGLMRAWREVR
jgi:indolepyruvate ferredoxin oxidoreductase